MCLLVLVCSLGRPCSVHSFLQDQAAQFLWGPVTVQRENQEHYTVAIATGFPPMLGSCHSGGPLLSAGLTVSPEPALAVYGSQQHTSGSNLP